MLKQNLLKLHAATIAAGLLLPAAAYAQAEWTYTDWDEDGNLELSDREFATGIAETGTFNAWDRDDTVGLSEGEFATGMFTTWDTDDDMQVTEQEYEVATDRWYGADYATPFTDYDADTSGYIDTTEFGEAWDAEYYGGWDADDDALLTEDEFTTGLYDRVDADDDMVVTIEEEGWFEGWFDGDDVEAEIQEVGDVL